MISFIIPTLSEEKDLEETLRCLTHYRGPHEVIVSDGGSTDGTLAIARKYADQIVTHEGRGRQTIAFGRNAGARRATGEYIVSLDADVRIYNPNMLFRRALNHFERDADLVGLTVFLRVEKKLETLMDRIAFTIANYLTMILNNLFNLGAAPGEFQMVRRDAFVRVGGYNEKLALGEDLDLFRRLSKIGTVYSEMSLTVYHTGRRAHVVGWPRLLWQWVVNGIPILFGKKSFAKEWKQIR